MKTMNKEFRYKDFVFNISVELNTKVEKRINGKRWHTITINDMRSDGYYKKQEVLSNQLETEIDKLKIAAMDFVDSDERYTSDEQLLLKLGFK